MASHSSPAMGVIFLIASFSSVSVLRTEHTTPYEPCPIASMGWYLGSTLKLHPLMVKPFSVITGALRSSLPICFCLLMLEMPNESGMHGSGEE